MIYSIAAISAGATIGALLRWGLGIAFNSWFMLIPLGTWLANMLGGYLMGLALVYFSRHSGFVLELQLFVMTGFLGSLTTFSTFSAEVSLLLQQGRLFWAAAAISAHVLGSLLMTFLGMVTLK